MEENVRVRIVMEYRMSIQICQIEWNRGSVSSQTTGFFFRLLTASVHRTVFFISSGTWNVYMRSYKNLMMYHKHDD